jgi:hypothetical protein
VKGRHEQLTLPDLLSPVDSEAAKRKRLKRLWGATEKPLAKVRHHVHARHAGGWANWKAGHLEPLLFPRAFFALHPTI